IYISVEMQSKEKLRGGNSITLDNKDVETSQINDSTTIYIPDVNSSMVYLNIYDLDPVSKVLNSVVKPIGTGAFHAGVEVYGYEYSFGYVAGKEIKNSEKFGKNAEKFGKKDQINPHSFFIVRCKTPLTKTEVNLLVDVMKLQWIGDTYDILSRQDIMKK
ncbi:hypothetical protein, partial [Plasmodium yoelii yoelii]